MINFIQMPTIPYQWMIQRPQHIMNGLSKRGCQIYYIEKNQGEYLQRVSESLCVLGSGFPVSTIKMEGPVVLWCSSPDEVLNIDKIAHDYVVYDIVDEADFELKGWIKYIDVMLKKADIVFTSSDNLYNKFKSKHKKVYKVNNGVDLYNFSLDKKDCPEDLPKGKKIVGYAGAIASWIDWDLVNFIVKDYNYNFVFIGPKVSRFKHNVIRSNVYFLGIKEYKALPYYINNFDCCIIPFKVNNLTNACNPIKLYEYFSLGKPVVSTSIKEAAKFNEICYIASSKEQFKDNIDIALNEKSQSLVDLRMKKARGNSWEGRIDFILDILKKEFNIQ